MPGIFGKTFTLRGKKRKASLKGEKISWPLQGEGSVGNEHGHEEAQNGDGVMIHADQQQQQADEKPRSYSSSFAREYEPEDLLATQRYRYLQNPPGTGSEAVMDTSTDPRINQHGNVNGVESACGRASGRESGSGSSNINRQISPCDIRYPWAQRAGNTCSGQPGSSSRPGPAPARRSSDSSLRQSNGYQNPLVPLGHGVPPALQTPQGTGHTSQNEGEKEDRKNEQTSVTVPPMMHAEQMNETLFDTAPDMTQGRAAPIVSGSEVPSNDHFHSQANQEHHSEVVPLNVSRSPPSNKVSEPPERNTGLNRSENDRSEQPRVIERPNVAQIPRGHGPEEPNHLDSHNFTDQEIPIDHPLPDRKGKAVDRGTRSGEHRSKRGKPEHDGDFDYRLKIREIVNSSYSQDVKNDASIELVDSLQDSRAQALWDNMISAAETHRLRGVIEEWETGVRTRTPSIVDPPVHTNQELIDRLKNYTATPAAGLKIRELERHMKVTNEARVLLQRVRRPQEARPLSQAKTIVASETDGHETGTSGVVQSEEAGQSSNAVQAARDTQNGGRARRTMRGFLGSILLKNRGTASVTDPSFLENQNAQPPAQERPVNTLPGPSRPGTDRRTSNGSPSRDRNITSPNGAIEANDE